ncbi:mitochondrial carrier protein mtm1 [Quercus suber]|uniref:Mitochondrial carrier protein mtm1 n=1 Tax=Quercus suber TaxID=58331 RepID=A0AAW0M6X9_QUESU
MVRSRPSLPSWISAAATTRVDFEGNVSSMSSSSDNNKKSFSDMNLGFGERAFSAAGAAAISAVLVNPLDIAKTRLQAQAAGVPYQGPCHMACFDTNTMLPDLRSARAVLGSEPPVCPSDCSRYTGTLDVLYKVIRQEGFTRLWRGTNASLALAVPTVGIYLPCYDIFRNSMEEFTTQNAPNLTPYVPLVAGSVSRSLACVSCYPVELARTRMQAFKETQIGVRPPGVWKTLLEVIKPIKSTNLLQNLQNYRVLWTGLGAQLARDVPFSAICWSTLEPIRRRILGLVGDEASAPCILGTNFSAGFVAGILAAAATYPVRALKMTTRETLVEIWRDGGMRGLFTGIGPRIARAGPSVGIVVSFYEVVKYALHQRYLTQ